MDVVVAILLATHDTLGFNSDIAIKPIFTR